MESMQELKYKQNWIDYILENQSLYIKWLEVNVHPTSMKSFSREHLMITP